MQTMQTKTVLWISAVYIFSFVCYVPMMLKQFGVIIPDALFYLKYCFVLIPALISIIFLVREHNLKVYLSCNFKNISPKEITICIITALIGISLTYCYSFVEKIDLFDNAYSSMLSVVISCVYLFVTALIEEIAWRGFFFKRVAAGSKRVEAAAIFVGTIWAIWHIPMWLIRNSLSLSEMIPLFIWAVLISIVLGMFYCVFGNILSVSLLHMTFNVCFLAPTKYNNIILFLSIIICCAFRKYKKGASVFIPAKVFLETGSNEERKHIGGNKFMAISNRKAILETDIEKVWDIVTSCTNYSWRSDLRKIEVVEEGKKFIEYTKDGYATTFIITVFEPYKRYEFDMDNDNMSGHWTGVFTVENGNVYIDFTETVVAKKLFMKPFVGMYLKKQQAAYLQDLKRALGEQPQL